MSLYSHEIQSNNHLLQEIDDIIELAYVEWFFPLVAHIFLVASPKVHGVSKTRHWFGAKVDLGTVSYQFQRKMSSCMVDLASADSDFPDFFVAHQSIHRGWVSVKSCSSGTLSCGITWGHMNVSCQSMLTTRRYLPSIPRYASICCLLYWNNLTYEQ